MSTFGEIDGYPEGSTFETREEIRLAGLHRHSVAGISGGPKDGADAIVLNEGYEDDEDYDETIIYTGQGGQDQSRRQVRDQKFVTGNAGLRLSCLEGHPVRVVRGPKLRSPYAPKEGYRYDGLYFVDKFWEDTGRSGHKIIRFRLIKHNFERSEIAQEGSKGSGSGNESPYRSTSTITRVVRDTTLSKEIKKLYAYRCQVCGIRLEARGSLYAEAAHIKPLGRPHSGPDVEGNILCLCPNHHALFDYGGFTINDDFTLNGLEGTLTVVPSHKLRPDCLLHHRKMFPI